ncbi:unnamed protein product [Gongylonema pulchrum]|uniref:Uncharacterized protein n=1 Tax=Gongylonema pulchrum TaxID=637853 RepID=A0A183DK42_9BILA|nr:unnamed protein product [Gongylonema pulchrum]
MCAETMRRKNASSQILVIKQECLINARLKKLNNNKLLVYTIFGANFTISLDSNEEYDGAASENSRKRYKAPRTMGSGFKVLRNAVLSATYRRTILGNTLLSSRTNETIANCYFFGAATSNDLQTALFNH